MKAGIKLVLAVVSVILLISLAANAHLYFFTNSNLQKQITEFQSQVGNLQNQINSLQNETSTLQTENSNLGSQIANLTDQNSNIQQQLNSSQSIINTLQTENTNLQNQLNQKNNPNLVTSLGIGDIRNDLNYHLFISGTVYNTGNNPAYNSKLVVTAYSGIIIPINNYIQLGMIRPGTPVHVSVSFAYEGAALSNWTVTPEWTNSP